MREYKIGEGFSHEGVRLVAHIAPSGCDGCYYKDKSGCRLRPCQSSERSDNESVIFSRIEVPSFGKVLAEMTAIDRNVYESMRKRIRESGDRSMAALTAMHSNAFGIGAHEITLRPITSIFSQMPKKRTRQIKFLFNKRIVTLVAQNTGNTINVGYSVYCDNLFDKNENPKFDKDLAKKIAVGRLEKSPIYSVGVQKDVKYFMEAALNAVKWKIESGELIIKGIK